MNKDFYLFGKYFSWLYLVAWIFQRTLSFLIDVEFYYLDSFVMWFWLASIISTIAAGLMFKYYYDKQYWFTFFSFAFVAIAGLCQLIIFYLVLENNWALQPYYFSAAYISLSANILYAISLIFSQASKNVWLKRAGILLLIVALILATTEVCGKMLHNTQVQVVCQKIQIWALFIADFITVFFILNFANEQRLIKTDSENATTPKYLQPLSALLAAAFLGFTVTLAAMLTQQTGWALARRNVPIEIAVELAKPFEPRIFVNNKGDTLRYRFMKPLNYDAKKNYPLVLCLAAEFGRENFKQIQGSAASQLLSKEENRKKYPAFLFVPECPPGKSWGNLPDRPVEDSLVFETINELEKEFAIDEKRLYVTGHSLGGYGTWYFICVRPNMFAAAIPTAGEGNPKLAKNVVDVAVWAFHGRKDRNVKVSGSRDMIEAMKTAGGRPRYTEFADERHNIWKKVEDTPGLLDWLFAQKRE